ncbi:MAG: DUF5683 domain-containing protein [Syntrophomonadaceae bacterium]
MYNHPGVAAVLSALLPGLGQVYNGQGKWALFYFIIHCGLVGLGLYAMFPDFRLEGMLFLAVMIMANMMQSATAAYNQALRHNAIVEKEESAASC